MAARCDRPSNTACAWGGVCIFTSPHIPFHTLPLPPLDPLEVVAIHVHGINVICIYNSMGHHLASVEALFKLFTCSTGKTIILGDFNLRHIDWPNISPCPLPHCPSINNWSLFTQLVCSLSFHQHVLEPTHRLGGILDLVFCRNMSAPLMTVYPSSCSDHCAVIAQFPISHVLPECLLIRSFHCVNYEALRNHVNEMITLPFLSSFISMQKQYDEFENIIVGAVMQFVPLKRSGSLWPQWADRQVKRVLRKKRRLWGMEKWLNFMIGCTKVSDWLK
eukprot:GHVN01107039.1.p1 GENE.GHVN01107039.1~~GHVN01107039.1.p1  ORF type:complete len:276 (+),score=9.40 GHVN01107039.1:227-1054(+)